MGARLAHLKSNASQHPATIIHRLLLRRVIITRDGQKIKVPALEAIMLRLLHSHAEGNPKAYAVWELYRDLDPKTQRIAIEFDQLSSNEDEESDGKV